MRVQQIQLAYRLDELRTQHARAQGNVRQLEIEVATLSSPGRLEARARQLGLVAPGRDQIRLAREYVAGGTGLAATRFGPVEALAKGRAAISQPRAWFFRPRPPPRSEARP